MSTPIVNQIKHGFTPWPHYYFYVCANYIAEPSNKVKEWSLD